MSIDIEYIMLIMQCLSKSCLAECPTKEIHKRSRVWL